ncbi:MAG: hypothetical protein COU51_00705 [Parcubacteria group bacterium CG10_big_fil_rev_8_21_14_0_10_36_14]|nr:MAG: hypothetical protein COU51_00705 [Parcubacteria group bacterium CG10_big_fil_rev_8_21_14_0_10_36_14]
MQSQSTHFIFDGSKVIISPNLHEVIIFLQEIEKEIENFINFDKKLESIRKQHLETIKLVEVLAGKLKENSIDFKFTFSEHPASMADKLKRDRPIRSEMIVLFANLETLFCLNIAYENKTSDEKKIIKKAMNQENIKSFIEEFCLNPKNEWCQDNQERLEHITTDDLRKLRNSLTHFFSVAKGLGISYAMLDEKSRRLEIATDYKAKFVSPEDLYGIIKGAAKLMIIKWSADCKDCLAKKSNEFKEKILAVKSVVKKSGAIVVKNNQINI